VSDRFSASGFDAVDSARDAERYVAYLDEQAATPFWRALKRETLDALELTPGARALDIGCGTGDEVRAMALAGADAIGADPSQVLLAEARRRTPADVAARFEAARAEALPFADAELDAVRVERTLQHVDDLDAAIREIARVTRPGGRLAAVEPDWNTLVVDDEVSATVRERWAARIRNPSVGRELRRRFAAFEPLRFEARTSLITDVAFAERQLDLAELLDAPALARLRAGPFVSAITYFLLVGRRL
jgi:ubiquinone/menaquinone biosynthesis C-methylase UbiE